MANAVAVLDGGFAKWARGGRPTRGGVERRQPVSFEGRPRPGMRVTANQVWARLGDPSTVLVDARAPARYEGREEPLDRVAGHIPGARDHFFQWNLAPDGTFLPADELRATFGALLGSAFGWRSAFAAVALLTCAVLVASALRLPELPGAPGVGVRQQLRQLGRPAVLICVTGTVAGATCGFMTYTYIAPIAGDLTGARSGARAVLSGEERGACAERGGVLRFWVLGFGFWVLGSGCWVLGAECRVLVLGRWLGG